MLSKTNGCCLFAALALLLAATLNAPAQDSTTAYLQYLSWGNRVTQEGTHWVIHWNQFHKFGRGSDCRYYYNCDGCSVIGECTGNIPPPDPPIGCSLQQGPALFSYTFEGCDYFTQTYETILE
jgi:hypothetical protein